MKILPYKGNNLKIMPLIPENSIDAIVTDPPYGIHFMGKKWDKLGDISAKYKNLDKPHESQKKFPMQKGRGRPINETDGFSQQLWHYRWATEAFRVLKPGGYMLAFGGRRTYHRMVSAFEDAGFEIRDCIMWVYSSGFPAGNIDVAKEIDRVKGAKREIVGRRKHPTLKDTTKLEEFANASHGSNKWSREWNITSSTSKEAKQWEGWGTLLKPSYEPIVLVRKPLDEKTVAHNVLKHGTGAINIDKCRVEPTGEIFTAGSGITKSEGWTRPWMKNKEKVELHKKKREASAKKSAELGRWPANLIHDGSEEVLEFFPVISSGAMKRTVDGYGDSIFFAGKSGPHNQHGYHGTAARFFYCAKPSKKEKGSFNNHPTVKPVKLLEYLVDLVVPPNGIVLDPFAGSGTTGVACINKHCHCILIEKDPHSFIVMNKRFKKAINSRLEELKKFSQLSFNMEV